MNVSHLTKRRFLKKKDRGRNSSSRTDRHAIDVIDIEEKEQP